MDEVLGTFLEDSGFRNLCGTERRRNRKAKGKGRVEGVWVRRRVVGADNDVWDEWGGRVGRERDVADVEEDEEDEMIWWSWDGKIVGFSDW